VSSLETVCLTTVKC